MLGPTLETSMSLAKATLSDRHAGLFFGINGASAAVATPLAIILSMTEGFNFTILAGACAYMACLGLLASIHGRAR